MRHAFALIYVLVITVIIMITITSILTLGSSDIRQKNKVLATAGAYQMAQSGIEDGIANYKKNPSDCSKTGYFNVFDNHYYTLRTSSLIINDQGDYQFSITCSPSVTAIGYFKGSKLKLQADRLGTDNTKWNIYQVGF